MAASESIGIRLSLRGQAAVAAGLKKTSGEVTGLGRAMGSANNAAGTLARGLRGVASVAIASATTMGLAGGALAATMVTVGVKTAAANEQAQVAFTNMLGSAGAAREYLGELKKFAASTPFELPDVQLGAQRLMAMGVATRDVLPYLTAIGDAVSGMGGGSEQINQVVTAIGQIAAKGKVQGDEILQLTEAGIPALKILAAQYGVSTAEMSKMMEKGKIASADALPKLIDGIENGTKATKAFGGMMEAQSKTLAGRWSTIKDVTTQGLAGAVEPLLPMLGRAMEWLGEKLPGGMEMLQEGGGKVAAVLNVMRPLFGDLWRGAKDLAREFRRGFGDSGVTMQDLRDGVAAVSEQLKPDSSFMQGMRFVAATVGFATGKIARMQARAEGLTTAMQTAGGVLVWFRDRALDALVAFTRVTAEVKARTSGGLSGLLLGGGTRNTGTAYTNGAADLVAPGGVAGQRQGGGNVTAGKLYKINERGGEGFIPAQSGRIIPTRPDLRGSLSQGDINITVPVTVNDEEIARATVRGVKRQAARRR